MRQLNDHARQLSVSVTLIATLGVAIRYLGELWFSPFNHQSAFASLLGFVLLLIALSLWSPRELGPPRLGLMMVALWSLAVSVSGANLQKSVSLAGVESGLLVCALLALYLTRKAAPFQDAPSETTPSSQETEQARA